MPAAQFLAIFDALLYPQGTPTAKHLTREPNARLVEVAVSSKLHKTNSEPFAVCACCSLEFSRVFNRRIEPNAPHSRLLCLSLLMRAIHRNIYITEKGLFNCSCQNAIPGPAAPCPVSKEAPESPTTESKNKSRRQTIANSETQKKNRTTHL